MPKLPQVSGRQVVKALERKGYRLVRQRGSHIRLMHETEEPVTVPDHKVLGKGILKKILRQSNCTSSEFLRLLKS